MHILFPEDAHLCPRQMRIFPTQRCASFRREMRICETQDAHPRNGSPASAKRKPCIRHKEAPHPLQESPAFAARAHGILPQKKDAHPPVCGRCASPCKAFGADQPSGLVFSSPPPGVVEPPVPSPAPGMVSSAEAGSSIHSSCSVSTRARV